MVALPNNTTNVIADAYTTNDLNNGILLLGAIGCVVVPFISRIVATLFKQVAGPRLNVHLTKSCGGFVLCCRRLASFGENKIGTLILWCHDRWYIRCACCLVDQNCAVNASPVERKCAQPDVYYVKWFHYLKK